MWGADIIFIDLQYNGKYRYYFNMKEAQKLKIVIYCSFCFYVHFIIHFDH